MNIGNNYQTLFHVFYRWAYNLKLDRSPEYTALVTISFFVCINILSLIILVRVVFLRLGGLPRYPKYWVLALFFAVTIANFIIFIFRKEVKPPRPLNPKSIKQRNRFVTLYMVVSFILLIGLAFIRF